jgi:hypothetical protein
MPAWTASLDENRIINYIIMIPDSYAIVADPCLETLSAEYPKIVKKR